MADLDYDALTKQFAEITGTDEACAHYYLQDTEWNLELGLDAYYSSNPTPNHKRAKVDDSANQRSASCSINESATLKVITWNIDGLSDRSLKSRTNAVCDTLIRYSPDVVFLQEIVEESHHMITEKLANKYQIISGRVDNRPAHLPYYAIAILRRESAMKLETFQVHLFPDSQMERTLLDITVHVKHVTVRLFSSHLESMKQHANERTKQLQQCFKHVTDTINNNDKQTVVLFGGDLNMRDEELNSTGGIPKGVQDAWIATGQSTSNKFTWDMTRNDNLQWDKPFKPRCRFDRLYFGASADLQLNCTNFTLIGQERIRTTLCYPSDHWGICAQFAIK